ncbi:hypothetical protein CAPTEDRAFT_211688 [Capitella teleta]|uniref:Uncharacterized protein n=1 Tax=Capitella teleta TaxID=283909 RepID=R7UUQ1_CAPTE|nr:hypothetical protein CAPTEDRAFT_211688 [Capitella teleta]|eukprot:ELU07647.1 hypothetical protein CAPTEDRAFT_211688 [Capitella teleta]
MNAYKQWVRAVWFENGREVEGVAPGTWIKRGTVFWPKDTNAEPAYLDREEPNEKTWRSFKLVKVKFTSDKEEDCHKYDATTAEEGDDQDNRRGVKRPDSWKRSLTRECCINNLENKIYANDQLFTEFQKRTLHLLVEIRSLLQRAVSQPGELVERGQQNSLYYAAKQFTHIHEFPDLNTEDKYLSKDLEQNLNMDGQRGAKTAFRGSSLHVLIVESVLEKFSSDVTEQRIDEFIRNRLRNATKRQK